MLQVGRLTFLVFVLFCATAQLAHATDNLTVAAGAGYKRMVEELCAAYSADRKVKIERIFGNIAQITAQARQSGVIDLLIGDRNLLDAARIDYTGEQLLGRGRLVAAVAHGVALDTLEQLTAPGISRIAIADPAKATYGVAAQEYLTRAGIRDQVESKLLIVGTLPQITAYVISGEVDVGLINSTEAPAIAHKVARILPVDDALYSPILIVARCLGNSNDTATRNFISFLQTPAALEVIRTHGLQ